MKNFIIFFFATLLAFWACNPMEEIYDDIENAEPAYNEDVERVLNTEDYAIAKRVAEYASNNATDSTEAAKITADLAFNERFPGSVYVPYILSEVYPTLNKESTALVSYNTNMGEPAYINTIEQAEAYELNDNDYVNAGGAVAENGYFTLSNPPSSIIPSILDSLYANDTAGSLKHITYKYVAEAGENAKLHFEYDFVGYADKDSIGGDDGWQQHLESGTRGWLAREYSQNQYAQYSSYGYEGAEANIAYLITPAIDLSGTDKNEFSFDVNVGYYTHDALSILISNNYNGTDVEAATWNDVTSNFTIPQEPTSGYGTFVSAGIMDISAYSGTIYIAFKYSGNATNSETTTIQVDNILVKQVIESETTPDVVNNFFAFDGSAWNLYTENHIQPLNPDDYDLMGAPGNYDNFSDDVLPGNYLPQFLALSNPYAQEGDMKLISYNYFMGDTTVRLADEYKYTAGEWLTTSTIVESTEQFVHTGETGWIFDPTIRKQLGTEDYQLIVDYVKANINSSYIDGYGTAEFYHGASAYYRNFDLRLVKREEYSIEGFDGLDEAAGVALSWQRVEEALLLYLSLAYPDATPDVNGVTVYYYLTYYTYENDLQKNTYTGVFRLTDAEGFIRDHEKEAQAVLDGELTQEEIDWNITE